LENTRKTLGEFMNAKYVFAALTGIAVCAGATAEPAQLEHVAVTGNRLATQLMPPARQITTITQEEIELQLNASGNLAEVIAYAVPGMGQPSQTFTNYAQSLRGREMLVLIDGVPMNTNRDVSRLLFNLSGKNVERIDVVRGGNAIYGSGATGGVIFITTRQPTEGHEKETGVSFSMPATDFDEDGFSYGVHQGMSGRFDAFDYAVNLVYEKLGANFDANGDRIAPEPSQGDMYDADLIDVGLKIGRNLDENQRVQFSVSHFEADQDSDHASDPTVTQAPLRSVRARSIEGLSLNQQNTAENTVLSLDYSHTDILNSELHAQVFYRDYLTRFYPFDARTRSNNRHLAQTELEATVAGGRLTINTPLQLLSAGETELVWGLDLLRDESEMPVITYDGDVYDASGGLVFLETGRKTYMPPITHDSRAAFAQLHHKFNQQWAFDGGVRYDQTDMSFDDFVTLPQSLEENPDITRGGEVDYDAWLVNASVVFTPSKHHEWYLAFNQGFELPDVGLQVRNATAEFDIGSSDLQAIKTDNYELGWRGYWDAINASVAVYQSTSDFGRVQTENFGLTLSRNEEKIHGVEATFDFTANDQWSAGGTFTWVDGEEKGSDADVFQDMNGFRTPPVKVTGNVQYRATENWLNRLQALYSASHDYRLYGEESFGRREVHSYWTVDWLSRWTVQHSQIELGVENLTNEDYFPVYSQLLRSSTNTSYLPARGRTLRLSYQLRW
jgi:iron complex outermembrane receptor protein